MMMINFEKLSDTEKVEILAALGGEFWTATWTDGVRVYFRDFSHFDVDVSGLRQPMVCYRLKERTWNYGAKNHSTYKVEMAELLKVVQAAAEVEAARYVE